MSITLKNKQPKKINWQLLSVDIISSVLLVLFLYTALSKLWDYNNFKSVLQDSPLIKIVAKPLAWGLPVFEIVLAILLFFPITRSKGLYASLITLTLFTVYLIYMVSTEPHLPCNCGGVLNSLTWVEHIFFNIFFIGIAVTGIILYRKYDNSTNKSPP